MREIVLGTAGHVDHGKTSLVRALTGIDTDRLKEEKKRGITIELGFAFLDLPCGHRLGIIDVPGHERFVKNMVAGASGIDILAFVIAADEGIMPQTREHFEICKFLGVKQGLVIITKKDLVEDEWLILVQEEIKEFLTNSFLEDAPMVVVSTVTGENIDAVKDLLNKIVTDSQFTESHGPFRLPVDRIFSMKGFGAVVTGTSISGRIRVGDDVMLYPKELPVKIRGIQVHSRDVSEVEAGSRTAINLQGVEKDEITRGDMLASVGVLHPSFMMDADFTYLSLNKKPLKNRTRVRLHLGTAEIMGRVVLLDDEELAAGERTNVQLLLEEPVGVWPGDHYVVRSYSPVYTIGGGIIFSVAAQKRGRFKTINHETFKIYHEGSVQEMILLYLRESGLSGLTFAELSVRTGLFSKKLKKNIDFPVSARQILVIDSETQRMIAASVYQKLKLVVEQTLGRYHKDHPLKAGLLKEELRSTLYRGLDQKLFQYMVKDLAKKAVIVVDESVIRLVNHQVNLEDDALTIRKKMAEFYKTADFTTPTIKEVYNRFSHYPRKMVGEILDVLIRDQVLVKVNDTFYYDTRTLVSLQQKLINFVRKNGDIDAQGFKRLTGLTRKFSIPLLEYFDKAKVTIRVGDKRILRKA